MNQEVTRIYINGAELVVFLDAAESTVKEDILASTLYAQLAADKQIDRFTDCSSWHATLLKALSTFGWLRLELKGSEGDCPESDTFTPVDLFSELLPEVLANWRGKKLEDVLNLLFCSPLSDRALALRERSLLITDTLPTDSAGNATTVSTVLMQLGFVLPTGEKVSLCVAFKTNETLAENPFTQSFSRLRLVGQINCSRLIGKLDDLRYALFRHKINVALSERRELSFAVEGYAS
jgi:hypothetical protein